jgi:hypothetical protein
MATFVAPEEATPIASLAATRIPLRIALTSLPSSRSSAVFARSTRRFSSSSPSYVQMTDFVPRHHDATADAALFPSSDPSKRLSASEPANSMDPPACSIAAKVSEVRASVDDAADPDGEGADTTNHLTDPPRRAASTDAISPRPPGGEITTTSGVLSFLAASFSDEASADDAVGENGLHVNPTVPDMDVRRATQVTVDARRLQPTGRNLMASKSAERRGGDDEARGGC